MRLLHFVKTRTFLAGMAAGLLLFYIADNRSHLQGCSEEGRCAYGFPFEWGYDSVFDTADGEMHIERVTVWSGLIADLCVALIAGLLLVLLCSKLYKRSPTYK